MCVDEKLASRVAQLFAGWGLGILNFIPQKPYCENIQNERKPQALFSKT